MIIALQILGVGAWLVLAYAVAWLAWDGLSKRGKSGMFQIQFSTPDTGWLFPCGQPFPNQDVADQEGQKMMAANKQAHEQAAELGIDFPLYDAYQVVPVL